MPRIAVEHAAQELAVLGDVVPRVGGAVDLKEPRSTPTVLDGFLSVLRPGPTGTLDL